MIANEDADEVVVMPFNQSQVAGNNLFGTVDSEGKQLNESISFGARFLSDDEKNVSYNYSTQYIVKQQYKPDHIESTGYFNPE